MPFGKTVITAFLAHLVGGKMCLPATQVVLAVIMISPATPLAIGAWT
jgi:hypothetical protein